MAGSSPSEASRQHRDKEDPPPRAAEDLGNDAASSANLMNHSPDSSLPETAAASPPHRRSPIYDQLARRYRPSAAAMTDKGFMKTEAFYESVQKTKIDITPDSMTDESWEWVFCVAVEYYHTAPSQVDRAIFSDFLAYLGLRHLTPSMHPEDVMVHLVDLWEQAPVAPRVFQANGGSVRLMLANLVPKHQATTEDGESHLSQKDEIAKNLIDIFQASFSKVFSDRSLKNNPKSSKSTLKSQPSLKRKISEAGVDSHPESEQAASPDTASQNKKTKNEKYLRTYTREYQLKSQERGTSKPYRWICGIRGCCISCHSEEELNRHWEPVHGIQKQRGRFPTEECPRFPIEKDKWEKDVDLAITTEAESRDHFDSLYEEKYGGG